MIGCQLEAYTPDKCHVQKVGGRPAFLPNSHVNRIGTGRISKIRCAGVKTHPSLSLTELVLTLILDDETLIVLNSATNASSAENLDFRTLTHQSSLDLRWGYESEQPNLFSYE